MINFDQNLINVLVILGSDNWVIWWGNPLDKEAANNLVKLGLLELETKTPKESGDAPIGAWKMKKEVKDKLILLPFICHDKNIIK